MNSFDISVTVSAVIEHEKRFLMIEEMAAGNRVINQPAGHIEDSESFVDAVKREVKEETGLLFEPEQLVGIYRHRQEETARTWLRVAFTGSILGSTKPSPIDTVILQAKWMSEADIRAAIDRHRSPQVLLCLEDYLNGHRAPLTLIREIYA